MSHERRDLSPGLALGILAAWYLSTLSWWALAFWPAAGSDQEWLLRTRSVCFGTLANGLPDGWGWSLLIMAPLTMLCGLIAIYFDDVRVGLRMAVSRWSGRTIVATALTVAVAGLTWVGQKVAQVNADTLTMQTVVADGNQPMPEHYARLDRPAPDLPLVNQTGSVIRTAGVRGRVTFVTFAFAHCATICPTIARTLEAVKTRAGNLPADYLIITLDPWRDTPSSLETTYKAWQLTAGTHFLSGPVPEVEKVLDAFQVKRSRDEKNGDITHPALVYVIDTKGVLAYALNDAPVSWLAEAGRRAFSAEMPQL